MNRRDFVVLTGASILDTFVARSAIAQPHLAVTENVQTHHPAKSAHWLRRYKGSPIGALYNDARFAPLFTDTISAFSGQRMSSLSLIDRLRLYTGVPGQIAFSRGRYMIASGCMAHCGFNRAFLWIDTFTPPPSLHQSVPLALVALIDVDGPLRKLTLISNSDLKPIGGSVPTDFRKNAGKWLNEHSPTPRLAGGRMNAFEVRSPAKSWTNLTPRDIGLQASRCEFPLIGHRST